MSFFVIYGIIYKRRGEFFMEHAKSLWKETKALVAKSNKIG
jgi:hypothetical protein